ncbi:MAG: hypothetical protein PHS19_01340 [Eubacteriales bacterium]|nr:hypothetical protein [Eubacteriales bacterium]
MKRNIIILTLIGLLLMGVDFVIASSTDSIPLIQGENGLYVVRPEEGSSSGQINLNASVKTEESGLSKSYTINIYPYADENLPAGAKTENPDSNSKMSDEELMAFEMRSIISSINEDSSLRKVRLPNRLSSGEKIEWSVKRNTHIVPIAFAIIIIDILLYRNRNRVAVKVIEAEQDSIARQLPEFINRLVLLLNAGLVLNSAFEKSVEKTCGSSSMGDYFYLQMSEILNRVKHTNSSMHTEFRNFARSRRSAGGDTAKELMRISNIISDNISKGVELTDKLQRESEILWLNRKRNCEERGRIAETRLTLPLTLFLLVLIVITVSPALLEL